MCRKIRCDRESCKVLDFWLHLNKARDWWGCNREGSVWHHGRGQPRDHRSSRKRSRFVCAWLDRITIFGVPKVGARKRLTHWPDSRHAYASKASDRWIWIRSVDLSLWNPDLSLSLSFQVRRSSTSLNVRAGPIALCLLLIEDSAATGIGWISFFFIWSFQIGNNDHNKIGVEKKTDCSRAEHVYILHNKEMTPVAKRISELNKA
jgi:hypothetical protein